MQLSNYETHHFPNPLLPFIFHPCYHLIQEEAETNWHKNIEILHCLEGTGYVRCGGDIYDFAKHDTIVVNPDLLHTIGSRSSLKYNCLIVGNSFCAENGLDMDMLTFQNVIRDPQLTDSISALALAFQNQNSGKLCAVADCRYAVLGVLRRLCHDHSTPKTAVISQASGEYVKKAITYIRTHFAEKLSLDGIADHIGVSKFHLCREFKALTGNSMIAFLNILRCSEAKRLIENGMSVSAAAYACGFENLSYFSRTFQKHMGALPSAFTLPCKR